MGKFFEHLEVTEENLIGVEEAIKMAWNPTGWLVFCGPHGTGKTTLLNAIASEWDGHAQIPFTAVGWLDYLQDFVGSNGEAFTSRFRQYVTKPLLAMDELAKPKATEWAVVRLTELVDFRWERALPTVFALDQDEEQLAARFGVSLADRVFDSQSGLVKVVDMWGKSRRTGREW